MSTEILPSEFSVAGVSVTSTAQEDLSIDRSDLSGEFERHAQAFNVYATSYELCLDYETRLKSELERLYAVLDVASRSEMENAKVKVTEKKVENMVITSAEYVKKQSLYFDACLQTKLMKATRDAMMAKKDCLISLGANIRAELASEPYMKNV